MCAVSVDVVCRRDLSEVDQLGNHQAQAGFYLTEIRQLIVVDVSYPLMDMIQVYLGCQ